jgi:hypothetical protein
MLKACFKQRIARWKKADILTNLYALAKIEKNTKDAVIANEILQKLLWCLE